LIAFPPGGPTDFVGRLLADKMSTLLGQRVYIETRPVTRRRTQELARA
jgi:tripartite-type tricarboxylate transporter receptor subunit TctC